MVKFTFKFPVFFRSHVKRTPIHLEHLVERIGLRIIILLGESVISLASVLRGEECDAYNVVAALIDSCSRSNSALNSS